MSPNEKENSSIVMPAEAGVPRIKGTALLSTVRFLRANAALARPVLPANLHKYLEARILAASWYPEEDQLELTRAVAKIFPDVAGSPGEDIYVHMGRLVARQDLTGPYARFVVPGDMESAVRIVSAAWKQYHDTGSMEARIDGAGRARMELVDYGFPHPEMCRVLLGWYEELFRIKGATEVRLTEVQCRNRGAPSCVWQGTWK
jgi:hypothetical protein